ANLSVLDSAVALNKSSCILKNSRPVGVWVSQSEGRAATSLAAPVFSELNVVVEAVSALRGSGSLLRPPHLDRRHRPTFEVHTRRIKRNLRAGPISGIFTEHQ